MAAGVSQNTQEIRKLLKGFPLRPAKGDVEGQQRFERALEAANKLKFREFWDAEGRGTVYLNEFIWRNSLEPGRKYQEGEQQKEPFWLTELMRAIENAPVPGGKSGEVNLRDALTRYKDEQLRQVIDASVDREERLDEILDQHEGAIKYWLGMLMIDPGSAPATFQLICVARLVGEVVVMCLKEEYKVARPSQVCPAIVPVVDPPVTPAFPAGHALQSHLISLCLEKAERASAQPDLLFVLSNRIARNRVIAGLHYPLDNEAGVVAAKKCFEMLEKGPKFKALLEKARAEVS
jgi:acid phosphatase (class A)